MATAALRAWIQKTLRRTTATRARARLRIDGLEARVNPAPFMVADINTLSSGQPASPHNFADLNGTLLLLRGRRRSRDRALEVGRDVGRDRPGQGRVARVRLV